MLLILHSDSESGHLDQIGRIFSILVHLVQHFRQYSSHLISQSHLPKPMQDLACRSGLPLSPCKIAAFQAPNLSEAASFDRPVAVTVTVYVHLLFNLSFADM